MIRVDIGILVITVTVVVDVSVRSETFSAGLLGVSIAILVSVLVEGSQLVVSNIVDCSTAVVVDAITYLGCTWIDASVIVIAIFIVRGVSIWSGFTLAYYLYHVYVTIGIRIVVLVVNIRGPH